MPHSNFNHISYVRPQKPILENISSMHGHQLLIHVLKILAATLLRMFHFVLVFNMGLLL